MKNIKRIAAIFTIVSFLVITTLFPIPHKASAQTHFGGLDLFMFPCTCTAGALWFHWFSPLYIASPAILAGILVAPVTPVAFSYYYLHPGSYALGREIPGAGASCYIGVQPYCYPVVPNYGLITPYTGVSGG